MLVPHKTRLIPHPTLPHPDISVMADILRHPTEVTLDFYVAGKDIDRIRFPERHSDPYGERRYGLWNETCFECFVSGQNGPGYCEINMSPSGDWASFLFDHYRAGMREGPDIDGPYSDVWVQRGHGVEAKATYDLSTVPFLEADRAWRAGLSAVIEEVDGRKSWWALAHPCDKPDFHHPDCFTLELPAPGWA